MESAAYCRSYAGSLLAAPDVQPIKPFELQ